MTAGQLVALILAIIGGALNIVALFPRSDARLGFIGSALIALAVVFLCLDASGDLK